jgi:HD domain
MKASVRLALLGAFVFVVVVGAAVLVVASVPRLPDVVTVLALCVLVIVGSALSAPHGTTNVSLSSVVIISAYVVAGTATAIVIAFVGSLMLLRRPVPLVKRFFSIATRVHSGAVGAVTYVLLDGPVGESVFHHVPRAVLAVTAAGVSHQVVNAGLMCLYMAIERGREPVLAFLRNVVRPTAIPMLGYSYLSFILAVMWLGGLGVLAALLVFVPLAVARWALAQDEAESKAQAAALRAFVQVIETKDLYTRGHSERVSSGVGMLGRHIGLSEERQHALEHAGLLHDVGKVGVPTSVIRKPGKLDEEEWAAIRLHPARGTELISGVPFLEEVKSAVLHHHEKYDGTGYPAGLSGNRIPYFARMIGIVDAFDCMTTNRAYRAARSVEETLAILIQDRNTHFDPKLVDAFVEVVRRDGWQVTVEQPAPDASIATAIDHDDLSLRRGGGASGSVTGPAT